MKNWIIAFGLPTGILFGLYQVGAVGVILGAVIPIVCGATLPGILIVSLGNSWKEHRNVGLVFLTFLKEIVLTALIVLGSAALSYETVGRVKAYDTLKRAKESISKIEEFRAMNYRFPNGLGEIDGIETDNILYWTNSDNSDYTVGVYAHQSIFPTDNRHHYFKGIEYEWQRIDELYKVLPQDLQYDSDLEGSTGDEFDSYENSLDSSLNENEAAEQSIRNGLD